MKSLPFYLLLACLLLSSVVGARLASTSIGTFLLLISIILISIVVLICTLSKQMTTETVAIAILTIGVALLLQSSLVSDYLIGYDVHCEYYVFRLTFDKATWNAALPSFNLQVQAYNSMLSITIFPAILALVSGIDGVWIFKIIYPLMFSLVPLVVYLTFHKLLGRTGAFLSAFFIMQSAVFYSPEMLSLGRQMVAELFLVLLLYLLLSRKIDSLSSSALFVIFSFALVTSHYATLDLLLFCFLFAWFVSRILLAKKNQLLSGTLVVLSFALAFAWMIVVPSSALLENLIRSLNSIFTGLSGPLRLEPLTSTALGISSAGSFLHEVGRDLFYLANGLVIVGLLRLLKKSERHSPAMSEYFSFSLAGLTIIALATFVPNFSWTMNMTRIYQLILLLVAPLCILGGETVYILASRLKHLVTERVLKKEQKWNPISKRGSLVFVSLVLIALFLFQVGFSYEIAGDVSFSISLNFNKVDKAFLYQAATQEQEVFSARWLSAKYGSASVLYSDSVSERQVLISYGLILNEYMPVLSANMTPLPLHSYVYLNRLNVEYNMYYSNSPYSRGELRNMTEISSVLNGTDLIYSNGGSSILYTP